MKETVVKRRLISKGKAAKKVQAFLSKRTLEETVKGLLETLLKTIESEGKD